MFGRHFELGRIKRLCSDSHQVRAEDRFEVASHLCAGCKRCWSAVSEIAPDSVRHSCNPVVEALYHLTTPRSRAVLRADHLTSIEEVRQRPFGFGFLLVEEAYSISASSRSPKPIEDDVPAILGTLRPRRHEWPLHEDLHAAARAYLSIVRTARGELDPARRAWVEAERRRHAGTGDERTRATVLEARAVLAAALEDHRHAEELLSTAMMFLDPDHTPRRVELLGRLAEVVIGAGETERVPNILASAQRLLATERASTNALTRARAIYRGAKLTASVATRCKDDLDLLVPAVRQAAAELEEAGELFAAVANRTTQALRLFHLGRLYSFFDPRKAAATYVEILERFRPEAHLLSPARHGISLHFAPESSPDEQAEEAIRERNLHLT